MTATKLPWDVCIFWTCGNSKGIILRRWWRTETGERGDIVERPGKKARSRYMARPVKMSHRDMVVLPS